MYLVVLAPTAKEESPPKARRTAFSTLPSAESSPIPNSASRNTVKTTMAVPLLMSDSPSINVANRSDTPANV